MSREYQNGDGFGYLLSFRRQGSTTWQTARVPGADARHFVYSNDSVQPYTPFEVKIRSYNRRGDGPESLTTLVHSAEEGGPPHPQLPGRGVGGGSVLLTPHLDSTPGGRRAPGLIPRSLVFPSGLGEGGGRLCKEKWAWRSL